MHPFLRALLLSGPTGDAAGDAAGDAVGAVQEAGDAAAEERIRLMRRYQGGDAGAFERLYAELAPRLRAYLRHLSPEAARVDDLLQETFFQLHRSRRTYVPPRPVRAWAFGIARHVFLMDRRTRSRRSDRETQPEEWVLELASPVTGLDPGDKEILGRSLGELPPERREILLMHHVLGLSFQEIGGILGVRPGTAKVRAHRAMVRLREIVADLDGPAGRDGAPGGRDA